MVRHASTRTVSGRSKMPSIRLESVALAFALLAAPALVHAQQRDEPPVCLGFTFGQWTPVLDWKAAGHETRIDPSIHQHADDGRDWATTQAVQDEHTIMLLPSWWPAGVSVTLPTAASSLDTAKARILTNLRDLGENESAAERVTPVADLARAVHDVDYVVEAVLEDLPLKQKLFAEIENQVLTPHYSRQQYVRRFQSPVSWKDLNVAIALSVPIVLGAEDCIAPLVEVIETKWTSAQTIDFTIKLHADAGKAACTREERCARLHRQSPATCLVARGHRVGGKRYL